MFIIKGHYMIQASNECKPLQQTFKWRFNLLEKCFDCDPLLLFFLGGDQQTGISLAQFFSRFEGIQHKEVRAGFLNALDTKQCFESLAIINSDGNRYLIKLSVNSYQDKCRVAVGEFCCLQLFPSKQLESDFLNKVFKDAERSIMLADSKHIIVMVNRAFCEETGYAEHELLGKNASILKSGHYEPEFYSNLWNTINTKKHWSGELLALNKQQEVYTREVQIQRFELDLHTHFYYSASSRLHDSTSLLHSDSREGNYHSNIPDKTQFNKGLQRCFSDISKDKTIVFTSFRIKWLQKVNEFTACWLVSQRFHSSGKPGVLGIISKGVYCIYWVEDKNSDKINRLLHELLKVFTHGFGEVGIDLFSTVSFGVSILNVDAKDPAQLIAHSTQTRISNPIQKYSSLYYFDRRLTTRFNQHRILAKSLRKAINEQRIEVHYQPIVELSSMRIRGFEALFRVHLKTNIAYQPQQLLDIAEDFNWIDEIDALVTQKALQALPQIQAHYGAKNITLSVNRSLVNDKMTQCSLENTLQMLKDAEVDLQYVTVELAESAVFKDIDKQKRWVEELQASGVKIALDNFGRGYSSLAYLNKLTVNYVKIDRSMINGLTLQSNEYAMVEMLVKLVHRIGGEVIVGGVDNLEQLALLSCANVDLLQGNLFTKPLNLTSLLACSSSLTPYSDVLVNSVHKKHQATVVDLCISDFTSIDPNDRLIVIKQHLAEETVQYFPVVSDKKCLGVLYARNYYQAISHPLDTQNSGLTTFDKQVHQVMERDVLLLRADSEIAIAADYLTKQPDAIIAVNNHQDECVGIVTIKELIKYYQQGMRDLYR